MSRARSQFGHSYFAGGNSDGNTNSNTSTGTATTASASTAATVNSSLSPSHSVSFINTPKKQNKKSSLPSIPLKSPLMMRQSSSPVPFSSYQYQQQNGTASTSTSSSQQQQRSMKSSHSMLLNRNTSAGALSPRVPIRQSASSAEFGGYNINRSMAQPTLLVSTTSASTNAAAAPLGAFGAPPDQAPKKPTRTTLMKAAEAGKGTLLPDFYSRGSSDDIKNLANGSSNATRSMRRDGRREAPRPSKSASSLNMVMDIPLTNSSNNNNGVSGSRKRSIRKQFNSSKNSSAILPTHHVLNDIRSSSKASSKSNPSAASTILRRRAGTSSGLSSDDDEEGWATSASGRSTRSINNNNNSSSNTNNNNSTNSRISPYRLSRARARRLSVFRFSNCKLGHILQVCIVLAIGVLVWESHHKAMFATRQLDQFKEEESLLLLHLQKIERQSIQLHENFERLALNAKDVGDNAAESSGETGGDGVNIELIEKQKEQLYEMEEELNREVKALESRIQQSARSHIIQEFGEGPVQVVLELDFGNVENVAPVINPNKAPRKLPTEITVLLWRDTPHAAWTWLEQIGRHVWDDADIAWSEAHVIDASPKRNDPANSKIEFVEKGEHGHEAWTVGLRDTSMDDSGGGGLSMYINLQDNTHYHKHETCVGKIKAGFEVLQRLLEVSRSNNYDTPSSGIRIKSASAMHVAK